MDELEDKLNSILSDPGQMEKIAGLARTLMGGAGPEAAPDTPPGVAPGRDPGLLGRIAKAMRGGGGDGGREQALLAAMRPYLSEKRRGKMDRALQLARLARILRLTALEGGGGGDQAL